MKRPVRFFVTLSFAPSILFAQTATNVPPSRIVNGFDVSRLTRIDQALQSYVDRNEIAGAVALVLRDGRPRKSQLGDAFPTLVYQALVEPKM